MDAGTSLDWVRCTACWAIYAPGLTTAPGCPKCHEAGWVRTPIPDGQQQQQLRAPLEPRY